MAYIINNTRGNLIATVADGTVNSSAIPVALVGRGVQPYGLYENENYVYILENFCNPTAPPNPMQGQLWYDSNNDILNVRNMANTWTELASQTYVQDQKTSPAFTGVPTAPTAANGTVTTQIATTAFVSSAILNYGSSAGNTYAPINSPAFTGNPTAPTALAVDSSSSLATTAFVQSQKNNIALTGTPVAPTPSSIDDSTQIATTAFVQAQKVSPALTGAPTSPTPSAADNSTKIATTAFVQAQKNDTVLTGTPVAPTPALSDDSTKLATTAFVQAQKLNIALTGTPTAPTATAGTNTNQIATTAFVATALTPGSGSLGTMSLQNSDSVTITGGTITGLSNALPIGSGGTGATSASTARVALGIPPFPLSIANGGTDATDAATARQNLGLGGIDPGFTPGTIATQNANAVSITGGTITGITSIAIADGGTGAATAVQARLNLGLGNLATQSNNAVNISGGQIFGLSTPLPIGSGGTGAATAPAARSSLGLGSISTQDSSSVTITGGSITGLSSPLPVLSGGTGVTSYSALATALGLSSGATTTVGTMALQNASAVAITGGTISGLDTPLPVLSGGTGASTAAGARSNLGLGGIPAGFVPGTMATQNASAVAITGGTISGLGTPLPVLSGGTGASTEAGALTSLGAVPSSRRIVAGAGLSGGGTLDGDVTLSIGTTSNGYGTRYIGTGFPTGGNNGDIFYRI